MNKETEPGTGHLAPCESEIMLSAPALLELDVARYGAAMEDLDLTEDQKRALLEALWAIMKSFVELGFQVDVYAHVFDSAESGPPARDD